jgi:hypothetical protein
MQTNMAPPPPRRVTVSKISKFDSFWNLLRINTIDIGCQAFQDAYDIVNNRISINSKRSIFKLGKNTFIVSGILHLSVFAGCHFRE